VIQNLVLSDDEHDEEGLAELGARKQAIAGEFADLFAGDSGGFKRERFMRACVSWSERTSPDLLANQIRFQRSLKSHENLMQPDGEWRC
jgi:hypothetical protein